MKRFEGKVVFITGVARGQGREHAVRFAAEGASIIGIDICSDLPSVWYPLATEADLAETTRRIEEVGGASVLKVADVRDRRAMREVVKEGVERFGRLDVICANAGTYSPSPTEWMSDDAWDETIDINLSGVFYGMKYQIAAMLKNGGGSIINMASILGSVGFATAPAYTAAKHGVVGLTKAAAIEYSAHGVRINAVGPAFIHTPMISGLEQDAGINAMLVGAHPIGRLGQPEEVAELVTWLASSKASFVTGAYYPVDGGYLAR